MLMGATRLERLRHKGAVTLSEAANEALRIGLHEVSRPKARCKPFQTRPIHGVTLLLTKSTTLPKFGTA